jgi:hypothetical protein
MHDGKETQTLAPQWSASRLRFRSRMLGYDFGVQTPDSKVLIFGLQGFNRNGGELIDFEIWREE